MSITAMKDKLRALDEADREYELAGYEPHISDKEMAEVRRRYDEAKMAVIEEARRVAEQAGEPVAAVGYGSEPAWLDSWLSSPNHRDLPRGTALYTTPPSADALVEALGKLSAEWRKNARSVAWGDEFEAGSNQRYDLCADTIDALIAKQKENSR